MRLIKTALLALTLFLAACDTNHRLFRDGVDGNQGQAGSSCHVTQTPTGANISCDDGSTATVTNGANGVSGAQGADGSSCSVTSLPDHTGALVSCTDGTNVVVLNGTKGDTGATGMNATPVNMVQLCPGVNSVYPEQAFALGGKLYAVYSASGNASLALLVPGTYTTTAPGQNCTFTVQADGFTVTH